MRGSRVAVRLTRGEIQFRLRDGPPLDVIVRGQRHTVTAGDPTVVPLEGQGPVIDRTLGSMPLVGSSDEHDMLYTAGVPDPGWRRSAPTV